MIPTQILSKAFEAGVKAAIELFKTGKINPQTLAKQAEKVSKSVAKAAKNVR